MKSNKKLIILLIIGLCVIGGSKIMLSALISEANAKLDSDTEIAARELLGQGVKERSAVAVTEMSIDVIEESLKLNKRLLKYLLEEPEAKTSVQREDRLHRYRELKSEIDDYEKRLAKNKSDLVKHKKAYKKYQAKQARGK